MKIKPITSFKQITDSLELVQNLHDEHNDASNPFNLSWKKEWIKKNILREEFLFAEIYINGNKVIGYILGEIIKDEYSKQPIGHLRELYIKKAERLNGYGTELVKYFYNWSRINECKSIILNVESENLHTIGFYENLGFKKSFVKMVNYL